MDNKEMPNIDNTPEAPVTPVTEPTYTPVTPVAEPVYTPVTPVAEPTYTPVTPVAEPVYTPVAPVAEPVYTPVAPVAEPVVTEPTVTATDESTVVVDPNAAVTLETPEVSNKKTAKALIIVLVGVLVLAIVFSIYTYFFM